MNARSITMPDLTNRRAKMHYISALNELARLGVDTTRVDLLAVSEFWNYRGEVHTQTPAAGTELRPDTPIRLEIGYPSAVDMLPHQFFVGLEHRPDHGHLWEDRARRLMAPFDAAVIRHDAWALYRILKVSFGYFDRGHIRQFLEVFGISEPAVELTDRELLLLAILLPAVHDWSGNAEAVTSALELFFGYHVEIQESIPQRYSIPPRLHYRLGGESTRLGADTLVGASFAECDSAYRITLRGIDPAAMPRFLPGRSLRRKLDWLVHLITPGNLNYELRLVPFNRQARLGNLQESYLGHSMYLRRRASTGSST